MSRTVVGLCKTSARRCPVADVTIAFARPPDAELPAPLCPFCQQELQVLRGLPVDDAPDPQRTPFWERPGHRPVPVPEYVKETARAAAAAGLGELDGDQCEGAACVHCRRTPNVMVPLEGFYGGRQLFKCSDGIACAAAAEQLPGGVSRG